LLIEAQAGDLFGVVSNIARFDTGTPMGWLQAVIELTLQRKDAGAELEAWLKGKYS
jgi:UTP-glucose-1-phosphate uridylyltransferase